jgi:hypothetical protein
MTPLIPYNSKQHQVFCAKVIVNEGRLKTGENRVFYYSNKARRDRNAPAKSRIKRGDKNREKKNRNYLSLCCSFQTNLFLTHQRSHLFPSVYKRENRYGRVPLRATSRGPQVPKTSHIVKDLGWANDDEDTAGLSPRQGMIRPINPHRKIAISLF